MILGFRRWSERGSIQCLDHVRGIQSVLARNGLDSAVVAGWTKMELLENCYGCGMPLFNIADDHVRAGQLIESKH
jgi:hypothetical protein